MLTYHSGEVGLLYVDPRHMQKDYASMILINEMVKRIKTTDKSHSNDCVEIFIMDGNDASHATFRSLGWQPEEDQKKGTGNKRSERKWIYQL